MTNSGLSTIQVHQLLALAKVPFPLWSIDDASSLYPARADLVQRRMIAPDFEVEYRIRPAGLALAKELHA